MISLKLDSSHSLCTEADLLTFAASLSSHDERCQQLASEPWLGLAEQQLEQYSELRSRSDLGRIFHVANGLHEHIDAIVVLGSRPSTLAIRGLMQACCDPHHNELSRAQRGCKPRVYFAGDGYDNDATASLLHRLRTVGEETSPAQRRFAILIHLDDQPEPAMAALPHFVDCFRTLLPDHVDQWLSRLMIPIVLEGRSTEDHFAGVQTQYRFELANQLQGQWNALSPATLLPAAFLGLDCMKLLEGAAAMNENYRHAPFAENLVQQYGSTIQCWASKHDILEPKVCVWENSLRALQEWARSLSPLNRPNGSESVGSVTWRVDSHRTDPVFLRTDSVQTFHEQLNFQIERFNQSESSTGHPTIDLMLPAIEPFVLGQLMQMMILSGHQQTSISVE